MPEYINESDLKEGEVYAVYLDGGTVLIIQYIKKTGYYHYYYSCLWLSINNSDSCISNSFKPEHGSFCLGINRKVRKAYPREIKWLDKCMKAGKYVHMDLCMPQSKIDNVNEDDLIKGFYIAQERIKNEN